MKLEAIAGDGSGQSNAEVYVQVEGAHVVVTIDPFGSGREDAMLTPDQAEQMAEALVREARLARIVPEES